MYTVFGTPFLVYTVFGSLVGLWQETVEQDSGVYLLLYAHGYFLFHNQIHTSTDEDINADLELGWTTS